MPGVKDLAKRSRVAALLKKASTRRMSEREVAEIAGVSRHTVKGARVALGQCRPGTAARGGTVWKKDGETTPVARPALRLDRIADLDRVWGAIHACLEYVRTHGQEVGPENPEGVFNDLLNVAEVVKVYTVMKDPKLAGKL